MRLLEADQVIAAILGRAEHDPVARHCERVGGLDEHRSRQGRAVGVDEACRAISGGEQIRGGVEQARAEPDPARRQQPDRRRHDPRERAAEPGGEYATYPSIVALPAAARMFPAVSRMKAPLSAAACAAVSGGTSRVLTSPSRGALAIIAIAQGPDLPVTSPRSPRRRRQAPRDGADDRQRRSDAVGLALFEVAAADGHLVGHMREAEHRLAAARANA